MSNKVDIDPKDMTAFMDRLWTDVDRNQKPSVVGPAKKCLHCDFGFDTYCNCQIYKVHAKWKDIKYISKKSYSK
jgi:hypothetical protein